MMPPSLFWCVTSYNASVSPTLHRGHNTLRHLENVLLRDDRNQDGLEQHNEKVRNVPGRHEGPRAQAHRPHALSHLQFLFPHDLTEQTGRWIQKAETEQKRENLRAVPPRHAIKQPLALHQSIRGNDADLPLM
jgi:hypothetical protein